MEPAIDVAPPAKESLLPLVRVPDHELLRVIGRGSYGEVWEARNLMGSPRAIKIVERDNFADARPFEREFEGIKRYEPISRSHAGLVKVLHVGMHPKQHYFYYVMELADTAPPAPGEEPGRYLPRTLRGELLTRGALPPAECIEIGITLASALCHLHCAGLVHRDVKPANIIFVSGAPQLADVGLVAPFGGSGTLVGTDGYFPPDGLGHPVGDIYSLGKVLYECVTGLDRHQFPDVPDGWGNNAESRAAFEFLEIVLRAAEADPERRYKSMEEMLADLAILNAGKSVRRIRSIDRHLKRTAQGLVIAALTIAIAAGAWLYERHKRNQIGQAEQRARAATEETRELLRESLVAEARALRLNGQAGAREMALQAVSRGRDARADRFALRSEAASALALTDIGEFSPPFPADRPPGVRTSWSDDGAFLVTLAPDGSAQVFAREGTQSREIASFVVDPDGFVAALSSGARWLAMMNSDHSIAVWDLRDGSLAWRAAGSSRLTATTFSSDGEWLVFSAHEGLIAARSDGSARSLIAPGVPASRHLLIAPDGTWLASLTEGDTEHGFRIYTGLPGGFPDAEIADTLTESEIPSDIRLEGPSISADSRYLAAAASEDRVRVWEIPSLEQIATLRGHQRSVRATAFHPDDPATVASTSWDGTTRLWNVPARREMLVAPTGGDAVMLLPDRGEILLRTWDGTALKLASLSPAAGLRELTVPAEARSGLLTSLSFSPDGQLLAAAGDAGVLAWDLRSGKSELLHQSGPQVWRDAAFSPDGTALWCSGKPGLQIHQVVRDSSSGAAQFGAGRTVDHRPSGHLDWVGGSGVLAVGGELDPRQPGVNLYLSDGTIDISLPSPFGSDRLSASPDGRWLAATRYPTGGGILWDLHADPPSTVAVDLPARASFGFFSELPLLAVGTDREIRFLPLPPDRASADVPVPLTRRDAEFIPARIVESATAGLIAFTTSPTGVLLCDSRTLRPIATLDSPLACFDSVLEFSPDGTRLALAGGVSRAVIWEIAWIKQELEGRGLGW